MATPQLFAVLYSTTKELEGQVRSTHQFIINSHKPIEALQGILKSHQAAMVAFAASVGFYRNLTLGSLFVTVISGVGALGAEDDSTSKILGLIAAIGAITTFVTFIIWRIKATHYANHQYMSTCYTQLIDVRKATQG